MSNSSQKPFSLTQASRFFWSHRRLFFLGIAIAAFSLTFIGCGRAPTDSLSGTPPAFTFRRAPRAAVVTFTGVVQASRSRDIALEQNAWGVLKWMCDEGTVVASGDTIANIDMSDLETDSRSSKTALRHAREQLADNQNADAYELGKLVGDVRMREREKAARQEDSDQLDAGKAEDYRWQTEGEYVRAALEREYSRQILAFQREVNKRGFDTPFALRKLELETAGREVEADYASRRCERLASGPTVEERARASHQIEVASGEHFLACRLLESASASRQISKKSIQFQIDINAAEVRKSGLSLGQAKIFAPFAGLIIYPLIWNQQKPAAGLDLWEGLPFLRIVSTGSFLIEAPVEESISSVLKQGMSAVVRLDPWPSIPLSGKILNVGKVARRERGRTPSDFKRFPVTVAVDVATLPVRLGIKGTVSLIIASGTEVLLPRDLIFGEGASATVRLEGFTGVSTVSVKIEPFDADFFRWLDPPADSGVLRF